MKAVGFALWGALVMANLAPLVAVLAGGGVPMRIIGFAAFALQLALCEVIVRREHADASSASGLGRARWAAVVLVWAAGVACAQTLLQPPPDWMIVLLTLVGAVLFVITLLQFAKAAAHGSEDGPGQLGVGAFFWGFVFVVFAGPFLLLRKPRAAAA